MEEELLFGSENILGIVPEVLPTSKTLFLLLLWMCLRSSTITVFKYHVLLLQKDPF